MFCNTGGRGAIIYCATVWAMGGDEEGAQTKGLFANHSIDSCTKSRDKTIFCKGQDAAWNLGMHFNGCHLVFLEPTVKRDISVQYMYIHIHIYIYMYIYIYIYI